MPLTIGQQSLRTAYTLAARRYARWVVPRFRPLVRELLAVPAPPRGPGVDVGSGTGLVVAEWRRLDPTAWLAAVDFTPAMLAAARGHPNARVVADAAALPFATGSVRAVTSAFLLHHLPALEPALAAWHRVLAPGGELRVLCWGAHPARLTDPLGRDPDRLWATLGLARPSQQTLRPPDTAAGLAAAARAAGFGGVDVRAREVTFVFADARACWRWWSAFPGMAAVLARHSRARRRLLRERFYVYLAEWPAPHRTHLEVLYLRARR